MLDVLDATLMNLLDKIQPKFATGSIDIPNQIYSGGCGCTGNCGQSCAGGCEAGCTGNCGRSCSGGAS